MQKRECGHGKREFRCSGNQNLVARDRKGLPEPSTHPMNDLQKRAEPC